MTMDLQQTTEKTNPPWRQKEGKKKGRKKHPAELQRPEVKNKVRGERESIGLLFTVGTVPCTLYIREVDLVDYLI